MNKRLLLLAILAAGVWAAAVFWPGRQDDAPPADPLWPPLDLQEAASIEQQTQGGGFTLTQKDGEWLLSGEAATPLRASKGKVEALLAFIKGNKPMRRLMEKNETPDPAQLAQYGLDKPESMVTFTADKEWRIALGAKNAAGDGVYALSSLEPGVLLLGAGYQEQLNHAPEHFYDLRLLDMNAEVVRKIRVQGDVQWEMARKDDEGWEFTWPDDLKDYPVAAYEANMFAHNVAGLEGTAFDTDFSPKGEEPALRFSVWRTGADDPEVLDIYTQAASGVDARQEETQGRGTRYVALSSWQKKPVVLDAKEWGKLDKEAFYLRERSVISVDQSAVRRMELVPVDKDRYKPLEATKADAAWEDGQGKNLLGLDVLLWRLGDLKYEAPQVKSLPPSAVLQFTWNLYDKDGAQIIAAHFYDDPGLQSGQCWIGVNDPELFYPVSRELLDDLNARLPPVENKAEPAGVSDGRTPPPPDAQQADNAAVKE